MSDLHDEQLRRREFLQRTALTAGLAAALATRAARRHARRRGGAPASAARLLPAPRNMPIDTFVVLMMENRSFDHYLGWMPNADGRQAGLQLRRQERRSRTRRSRLDARLAGLRPSRTPTTRGTAAARS